MVQIGKWLNQGWDWFVADLGINVLMGLLSAVFLSFTFGLVAGPVAAGLALAGLRRAQRGQVEVQDFFDGFRYFLPALLSSLLIAALVAFGFIFLIIPGLVILAMYVFTFHFLAAGTPDFWRAMESSRQLVARDYFGFTLFVVLLGVLNLLGLFFLYVGVLVTLPVTSLALTAAFLDLQE
jgi:uncharacterized membrane protein